MLADVRSYPGSRRYPHFNKENLEKTLAPENIFYTHVPSLGGRRKPVPLSKNIAWKNGSFRVMLIIWRQMNLKKELRGLSRLVQNTEQRLCVRNPCGGDVNVQ